MEAIKSGYADLMDYVILTDYPDDFKELGIEGLAVNEKKPEETIKSVVNFDLNLVLNKQ